MFALSRCDFTIALGQAGKTAYCGSGVPVCLCLTRITQGHTGTHDLWMRAGLRRTGEETAVTWLLPAHLVFGTLSLGHPGSCAQELLLISDSLLSLPVPR